jgi:hypothetical protein
MKTIWLISFFGLLCGAPAYAQEHLITPADTILTIERDEYPVAPKLPLTAADSAHERARRENARRIRLNAKARPAAHAASDHSTNYAPLGLTAPNNRQYQTADSAARVANAKRREAAKRQAAKADQKRTQTLTKRARKLR